jgi:hypothetical protein
MSNERVIAVDLASIYEAHEEAGLLMVNFVDVQQEDASAIETPGVAR